MSSQIQNKLLNYEALPPESAWADIAASLDKNVVQNFAEKLYEYEIEPSPLVWQTINSRLDTPSIEQRSKVVPFFVKYRRPLKYSGAVAAFVFLAVLTSLLIPKRTESELPQESITTVSPAKNNITESADTNERSLVPPFTQNTKQPPVIAKSGSQKARVSNETNYSDVQDLLPNRAYKNEIVESSFSSDKYMMYSDGEGNAVRLPKKIFDAFACSAYDDACKQRLKTLREKFAASAVTADFTGLLDILKSLQENQ